MLNIERQVRLSDSFVPDTRLSNATVGRILLSWRRLFIDINISGRKRRVYIKKQKILFGIVRFLGNVHGVSTTIGNRTFSCRRASETKYEHSCSRSHTTQVSRRILRDCDKTNPMTLHTCIHTYYVCTCTCFGTMALTFFSGALCKLPH